MLRSLAIALLVCAALAPAAQAAPRNGPIYYSDGSALWKVSPHGSNHERVRMQFFHSQLAFSPNGLKLIGVSGGLTVFDLADGWKTHDLPISGDWWGRPAWSPNGRQIAFSKCERSEFTDIDECVRYGVYRMRSNGSRVRRVAQGKDPTWSPDGRSLVFLHQLRERDRYGNPCNGLYTVHANGRQLRPVLPNPPRCTFGYDAPYYPSWSPDGRRVLFFNRGNVFTVRPDGSRVRRLVPAPRGSFITDGRWSPDGRRIAYSVGWGGARTEDSGIFVAKSSGGLGRRVAAVDAPGSIAWQPLASHP